MKQKNNDLVPQIFLAVVGVVLVGIIIYYAINSVNSTTRVADAVIANVEQTASDYSEHEILIYDGETIRGSEVVNFIKRRLGDFSSNDTAPIYVEVLTKVSVSTYTHTYKNKECLDDIRNFSNVEYYIKPTALFIGEVIKTENMVIIGVRFTQS